GRGGRLFEVDDHAPAYSAERAQFRRRAGDADARGRDHHRGDAVLPRRGRAAAAAGLGADAIRWQAGPDGRLLVADRVPGRLHHADGAVGQPDRGLATRQIRSTAPPALRMQDNGMPGIGKTGAPLLDIQNLSTHYVSSQGTRVVRAVDDVSLRIHAGETLGIVGESGSGKSTLALTILRVLPPAARIVSGRMMFEGEDLLRKSDEEMQKVRGRRIAMILQDPMASLNPLFTIGNQVAEPIRVHEGASRTTAWNRARELLKSVRIPSPETRVTQYPHEMSGGMRQR